MLDRLIKIISWGFFGAAVWLISKEVLSIGPDNIRHLFNETPFWIIGIMMFLTGLNYFILSGYDVLALEYIRHILPYPKIAETADISFAVSNTTGHIYAAGGAIRYLFYVPEGLSKTDVLKMIMFETITVFMGMASSYLIAMGMAPFERTIYSYRYINALYGTAILILLAFTTYYTFFIVPKRVIKIGKLSMEAPDKKMTIKQILLGISDNILLFLVFYAGLRYHIPAPFFETFMIFIIAQSIGLMTQVPGGLGVFESSFLYIFPYMPAQKGAILMSLILFRIIYYFTPFIIACLYLAGKHYMKKTKSPSSV